VLRLVEELDVRVWSDINSDWDAQPMWRDEANHAPGVFWGDTRVEAAGRRFREQLWGRRVLGKRRFFPEAAAERGSYGHRGNRSSLDGMQHHDKDTDIGTIGGGDDGSVLSSSSSCSSSSSSSSSSGGIAGRVYRCERAYAEAMRMIRTRSGSGTSGSGIVATNSSNSSRYATSPATATATTMMMLSSDVIPSPLLLLLLVILLVIVVARAVGLKRGGTFINDSSSGDSYDSISGTCCRGGRGHYSPIP
jgi:hypothetical protein